jgi:4a-hydroxytetrahydrobiopterin dehydratase
MHEGFLITKHFDDLRQEKYDKYNQKCRNDLKEMNENKIDNILASGGTDGWNTEGELDALSKTFQFDSFEQANAFCMAVGKFAETMDHHPEWQLSNGGKDVSVRLTSHFANNKVTLFDFELAQNMNKQYKGALKYNMFPKYTNSQFVSVAVGLGSVAFFIGTYKFLVAQQYITDVANLTNSQAPLHQLEGESFENHSGFRIN